MDSMPRIASTPSMTPSMDNEEPYVFAPPPRKHDLEDEDRKPRLCCRDDASAVRYLSDVVGESIMDESELFEIDLSGKKSSRQSSLESNPSR